MVFRTSRLGPSGASRSCGRKWTRTCEWGRHVGASGLSAGPAGRGHSVRLRAPLCLLLWGPGLREDSDLWFAQTSPWLWATRVSWHSHFVTQALSKGGLWSASRGACREGSKRRAPGDRPVHHSWIIGAAVVNAFYSPNRNQIGTFTPSVTDPSPSRSPHPFLLGGTSSLCSEGEYLSPPVGTPPNTPPAGTFLSL